MGNDLFPYSDHKVQGSEFHVVLNTYYVIQISHFHRIVPRSIRSVSSIVINFNLLIVLVLLNRQFRSRHMIAILIMRYNSYVVTFWDQSPIPCLCPFKWLKFVAAVSGGQEPLEY